MSKRKVEAKPDTMAEPHASDRLARWRERDYETREWLQREAERSFGERLGYPRKPGRKRDSGPVTLRKAEPHYLNPNICKEV